MTLKLLTLNLQEYYQMIKAVEVTFAADYVPELDKLYTYLAYDPENINSGDIVEVHTEDGPKRAQVIKRILLSEADAQFLADRYGKLEWAYSDMSKYHEVHSEDPDFVRVTRL